MIFYGESVRSSFKRARVQDPTPVARVVKDEKTRLETIHMQFLVKGQKGEGWVTMQLQKLPQETEFRWIILALDVKGYQRIYLEGGEESTFKKAPTKMFGIKWR
jgi:mitochondrial import inner membrane translocase subunit TIM21